ncbi:protein kinase [Lentisphaera marina]|uniref:serine/threonine-protein kinase n=1 Tax=Lentisphaera marina TaxID=1111041 RepID=UPI002365CC31|nr:serine/threonine-protein kinase [Lentisphaera marina]MDD7984858.1 protein kinase [Lentisphaera marina]
MADDRAWLLESFEDALGDDDALLKDSSLVREIQDIGGRYVLGSALGQGGQKKIITCQDKFTQRNLAMAVLRDGEKLSNNEAFINEARISAHLEHPNIVPLYDLGLNEDNKPYFTMKLLSGSNLQEIIENKKQTLNEGLEIFLKVCDAMAYAHSQGVLHLDLKPENIQIDDFGQVLVCDWGLAQKINQANEENLGKVKGSLAYMAPEQLSGTTLSVCSDIYALGGVLYSLLLGESPYSPSELKKRLKANDLQPECLSSKKLANLPKGLQAVFIKAIEHKAEDRYQSVTALSSEIRAYIAGFATNAENPNILTILKKIIIRHKALSSVLLLSIALVSILLTLSILRINNGKKLARQAQVIAEKSELKTRVLLADLKVEENKNKAISRSAAKAFFKIAMADYTKGKYEDSLKAVQEALKLDNQLKSAWDLRGKLEFGYLRFSQAKQSLRKGSQSSKQLWLIELADKGASKEGESKPSAKQIYDVRREIVRGKFKFSGLHALMFYNMVKNYSIEERWMFAEQSYRDNHKFFAGRDDEANFKRIEKGGLYSVDASGNEGTRMTIVLHELPIVSLDLSSSGVKTLGGLKGMPLKTLDISNTTVSSIEPLKASAIEKLNLFNCNVFDLSPLKETKIKHLILGGSPVDIKVLKHCKSLKNLELPKNVYSEKLLEELQLTGKVTYR